MASTLVGPIRIPQVNSTYYVGQPMLRTIQQAVTYAVADSNDGTVIIPQEYAGSDAVSAVTGGSATVFIIDLRGGNRQTYIWWQGAYIMQPFDAMGGLVSPKLNHYAYVGIGTNPTIQATINTLAAYPTLHFVIIISPSYTGSEVIGNLTGANANMVLSDQRTDQWQNYYWNGTQFVPSDFAPLGDIVAGSITADSIEAGSASFDTCLVSNSPVRTFANTADPEGPSYPPAGIGVSTGTSWSPTSINPANVAMLNAPSSIFAGDIIASSFIATGTPGPTPPIPFTFIDWYAGDGGARWVVQAPTGEVAAGFEIAGINGAGTAATSWIKGTTAPNLMTMGATTLTVGNANVTGDITGNSLHAMGSSGLPATPNSMWLDYLTLGRFITVGPSVGVLSGIQLAGIDSAGGSFTEFLHVDGAATLFIGNGAMRMGYRPNGTWGSGSPNINSDGSILAINAGGNGVYLNWDRPGIVSFGNGAQNQMGHVDSSGNAFFASFNLGPQLTPTSTAGQMRFMTGNELQLVCINSTSNAIAGSFNLIGYSADFSQTANYMTCFQDASTGPQIIVSATFTASQKNFRITHPLDETKDLTHSSLEGPEIAVFYRGEAVTADGSVEITLPDYFEALTTEENRSVQLTELYDDEDNPVFGNFLAAGRVKNGKFIVRSSTPVVKFYWEVKAVRTDVPPLAIETMKEPPRDATRPDGSGTPEAGEPKPKTVRAGDAVATGSSRTRKTH
jgi:hypothetical protein